MRLAAVFTLLSVLALGPHSGLFAHEGHDHKVMGTVTMAAADHLMLRDKDGKDVTIQVTKNTRLKAKLAKKVDDIRPGTRVVVTTVMVKGQMQAKTIEVGVAASVAK